MSRLQMATDKHVVLHLLGLMQISRGLFNSNNSPTRCNNFPIYYPDAYLQLNIFRAFSRPSSGTHDCSSSLWFYL